MMEPSLDAQALPVEVGQVVAGKYTVERFLARGGAGVVFRARHVHLLEPCAIKFMLPRALGTPMARERFLREARACARLKGDHVVRVFDVGELDAETPYMVLEYLEGMDLEEHLAQQRPLPVAEAVGYVLQICAGLAEAHAVGIVHRDLKPANVFLTRLADGTTNVKILDFGISKDLFDVPGGRPSQSRTEDGILVGSPLFMAPEQVRADEIDTRADLWAVGVILYYLVTGAFPFQGQKASDTMAHILHRAPVPPAERVPTIPARLEKIILRCLEKDPARRPASAGELAALLASPGASIVPERRRPRWILPAAIAGLAAAGVVVVALALRSPPPDPPIAAGASAAPHETALAPAATASAALPPPDPNVTAQASSAPPAAKSARPKTPIAPRRPVSGAPSRGFDLGSRQ